MSRALLWTALLLGALIVSAGAALQSEWLRDRVLDFALDTGVEQWSIHSREGRLLTGLVLEGVELEVQGIGISLERFEVRPALQRILFGQVALKTLSLDGLELRLPASFEPGDEAAEPGEISLPLAVIVDDFRLRRLRLLQNDDVLLDHVDLDLTLHGRGQRIDIGDLTLRWPQQGLQVSGDGYAGLDPQHPFGAGLDIRRRDPEGQLPTIEARLTASGSTASVAANLRLGGDVNGLLLANWNLTTQSGRVRGHLDRLQWAQLPEALDFHGLSFDVEGGIEALAWELTLDANWEQQATRLRGHGTLQDEMLELVSLDASYGVNTVTASGHLGLTAPHPFELELQGESLDLAEWLPELPTRLDLETLARGQLGPDAADRQIDLPRLAVTGRWNDEALRLRAQAAVSWPQEQLRTDLPRLELELGSNRLQGQGRLDDTLDLTLDADLDDLSAFWPELSGTISGRIGTRGSPDAPITDLDFELSAVRFQDHSLTDGRVKGQVSLDPATASALSVAVEGVETGGLSLHATAELAGSWPNLNANLEVGLPEYELALHSTLDFDAEALDGALITSLDIEERITGHWSLQDTLHLRRGSDPDIELLNWNASCLIGDGIGQPSLCLSAGRVTPAGAEVELELQDLALESFAVLLPEFASAHGALSAHARIAGDDVDVLANVDHGGFRVVDPADQEELFADDIEQFRLQLQRRGQELEVDLSARATLMGLLALRGALTLDPDGSIEDAVLDGGLRLDVADLTPFAPMLPGGGGSRIEGTLSGALQARGRLGDPTLSGRVDLDGAAEIPALALELRPVTLALVADADRHATLTGRFHVGEQILELDAEADWELGRGLAANGQLRGDAIPLAAMPDLNLTLSPDLRFALDEQSLRLEGRATIPEARARVRALPQGGGDTLSQDVVIHRPSGEEAAALARDLYLNLTVILGDDVRLSAAGLETRLVGRLQLNESPGAPLTAQGRLETRDGNFSIYGQELTLRTGRLSFDGPLENPAVDVLAVRRVNSAEVGVQVSGFLDALETRIYSSPQRDEVDALTMLITGRMPGEASSAELANVSDAALNFGIGQAVPVVGRLVNRLGIDELAVDSPLDEDTGAVVVGTRLTDDIFVRYTYGLHSRLGGLQIEYRVTDWLSVQSETGTTQAVDVIFRREFN